MFKLNRFLKPFAFMLSAAILLLLLQAICDLKLPNYMSNIVNIGIQQNGIDDAAPVVISQNGMSFMQLFMNSDEKALLNSSYTLKDVSSDSNLTKKYPDAKGSIYVLNDGLSTDTLKSIGNDFGIASWTMIDYLKDMQSKTGGSTATTSNSSLTMNADSIDLSKLYAMQPLLAHVPAQMLDPYHQEAAKLDPMVLDQTQKVITGAFYKELGVDMGQLRTDYILKIGGIMLMFALISGLATVSVSFYSARISAGVARDLRNAVFSKVESFSNSEFDHFSTASLITRSSNDITQIQMFLLMGLRMICYAPMMGIGGVIMALNKSVSMAWTIAAAVIVLLGLIMVIFAIVLPKFKSMQKLIDRLNLVAREALNGLMVIRAFGRADFEKERFEKANVALGNTSLFVNRAMAYMMPIMMLIMNGTSMLIIWVGAHQVADSHMQVGDMIAFMQYAMQIIMSFLMISMMFIFIPRVSVSGARIAEVLDTKPEIIDPEKPQQMNPSYKGLVEFKDVCFRYRGAEEDVLHNITFTAKPGQVTAFIGATGSGKTTLINMIPRFYDVTAGEVKVNGVNVKEVTQKELRSHIGLVPQKSILMSGTIESNIKYGNNDATDEDMAKAAEIAQAVEFISGKDDGYASEIAQGGGNVSGGQKQRLSIARALAIKPDIYIFDDSFSALDMKTDATLNAALRKNISDATVIVIAQRVSTIKKADIIHILEDGVITASGTHSELLKTSEAYYEIASSQLSKEELENE